MSAVYWGGSPWKLGWVFAKSDQNRISRKPWIFLLVTLAVAALTACESQPDKNLISPPYTYIDSTLYYADRQASISVRASFNQQNNNAGLAEGYRFQFRSIRAEPVFLNSISIVAGGKRFFLEAGQVVVPNQQGVTLQLPLDESKFVASFPSALIQFRHNNDSYIFSIELHQLKPFTP